MYLHNAGSPAAVKAIWVKVFRACVHPTLPGHAILVWSVDLAWERASWTVVYFLS